MKKLIILVILIFLAACSSSDTTSPVSESESGEKVTFRLGHNSGEDSLYHIPAMHFAELVEEKTNGSVVIDIYPGAQLGGSRDLLENLRRGVLEMVWIEAGAYDTFTPVFNGLLLPFLVGNSDNANEFYQSDVAKEILASLEEQNIKGLAFMPTNMRQVGVTSDVAIDSPEDLNGLLIRAPGNQMLLDSYTHLGMDTTSIPYQESYSALQTGVIEGMDMPTVTWWTDGFYEVIDTLSMVNTYPWPAIAAVNLDTFESLSPEQQQAIQEAIEETYVFLLEEIDKLHPESLQAMKDSGVTIVEDVDIKPFREKMEPLYDKYQDDHPLIKKTVEYFRNKEN